MAIIGIGIDIVEILRIEQIVTRTKDRLAKRILAPDELTIYQQFADTRKIRFLAKRFAAKEAAAKALGTGISQGLAFNLLQVTNDDLGKPQLILLEKAQELAYSLGIVKVHLSLADERQYACATVIMEG